MLLYIRNLLDNLLASPSVCVGGRGDLLSFTTTTMLCSAPAAVWLLLVLSPGLSLSAEDVSESGFSLCKDCFYRQTPPAAAPGGPGMQPLCHRLPGGQAFATVSTATCDTAVYSAFHLGRGWTEEGQLVTENEDSTDVVVPALLRGGAGPSNPGSASDPLLQLWDSTVTTLVQSAIRPNCSALGGDLYVLTGRGHLWADGDGDNCQTKLLWSAVCCAAPEGQSGFSVGFIREAEEEERQASVRELEEVLGVAELFSGGCGGAHGGTLEITADILREGVTNTLSQADDGAEVHSDASGHDSREAISSGETGGEIADVADVVQKTSADAAASAEELQEGAPSGESSSLDGSAVEPETGRNSSSILLFVISTTVSILTAPLRPVFSTVTQVPGQVTYILQEDLAVLSTLPGDTFSLLYLLTSDLFSWIGAAADTLLSFGKNSFSQAYHCSSCMLGALLDSCYTGVTGTGTLAADVVGIFGNGLDNCWWVTKLFGGRVWDQSEGYVGTVVSEMGGQAKAVGGGLGRLAWRSGNGAANVFRAGGGLILGVIDTAIGLAREAFGQEAES